MDPPIERPARPRPALVLALFSGLVVVIAAAALAVWPRGSGAPPGPTRGPARVLLVEVATGLAAPVGLTNAGDGTGRLFVVGQAGVIRVIAGGTVQASPFLDISSRVASGGERGLLGLAFHPRYAQNGLLFVDYTRTRDGATVVSEFHASGEHADARSERIILVVDQPFANHNGGQLAFGPDGYLYIGLGDGGSEGDPQGNGQNTHALLGKILRIDVDHAAGGKPYAVPADNPFAPEGIRPGAGLPEIWAYGLRNPWRFSFDRRFGDLYIGDVGGSAEEEVDRQPADSHGGENYGWNVMEGRECTSNPCDQRPYVMPIVEYGHDRGCAVTGGYVYRGTKQPALQGDYLFGDYCSGTVFSLQVDEGADTPIAVLASGKRISSFGEGEDGEIYLVDIGSGGVFRLVAG
jgi:glucose/arabinose dehydrogenase